MIRIDPNMKEFNDTTTTINLNHSSMFPSYLTSSSICNNTTNSNKNINDGNTAVISTNNTMMMMAPSTNTTSNNGNNTPNNTKTTATLMMQQIPLNSLFDDDFYIVGVDIDNSNGGDGYNFETTRKKTESSITTTEYCTNKFSFDKIMANIDKTITTSSIGSNSSSNIINDYRPCTNYYSTTTNDTYGSFNHPTKELKNINFLKTEQQEDEMFDKIRNYFHGLPTKTGSWVQFLDRKQFSFPLSVSDLTLRIPNNVQVYFSNYCCIALTLLVYCLITSPTLLIGLAIFSLLVYFVITRNEDLVLVEGKPISRNQQLFVLLIGFVPLLYALGLTDIFFSWVGVVTCIVLLHSIFHDSVKSPINNQPETTTGNGESTAAAAAASTSGEANEIPTEITISKPKTDNPKSNDDDSSKEKASDNVV